MSAICVTLLFCVLAGLAGCSQPAPTKPSEAPSRPSKPAEPAVPTEIQSVAQSVLGSEAEVLTFGNLAHTGRQQVLVINRITKTPAGTVPGTLVTRAVIAENNNQKWKEVFRCDEHLKNPNGFLGGTPIAPVTGWRLQYEQNAEKGLLLFFTPLEQTPGEHNPTIGVRWNPKVKHYQSLDRNFEHFLGELPSLERFSSKIK